MKRILATLSAVAVTAALLATSPMTASAAGKGDFNKDGNLNTLDVRSMMSAVINNETITQQQVWWGDYDFDGAIDTTDARTLLMKLLDDAGSVAAPDYAHPTEEDCWGENTVALIGDSISFGAGAADPLPENSYVSYVKKAVQKANGGKMNYGFTSACATAWGNTNGHDYTATEIHNWPQKLSGSWEETDSGDRLYSYGFKSTTEAGKWGVLSYRLREQYADDYNYFCVYYQSEPDSGAFCIAYGTTGNNVPNVEGSTAYTPTASTDGTSKTMRSKFYKLSDCYWENGVPYINICHDNSGKPVTITGIGYYKELPKANNADGYVTFNAYTRGGSSLTKMSDTVLRQAASADTLICAMGYNDVYFNYDLVNSGVFAQKINVLIEACKQNGTQVIISDHIWDNTTAVGRNTNQEKAFQTAKKEYKRLAEETGGIYIDQQGVNGQAMLDCLNGNYEHNKQDPCDGVHPNSAGHKLIAKAIVSAMGLAWTESWS